MLSHESRRLRVWLIFDVRQKVNPEAIRYYQKWLRQRVRPAKWYYAMTAVVFVFFAVLSCYFRIRLGDWSTLGTTAFIAIAAAALGSLMIAAAHIGASVGSWTLLESLESGCQSGRFREVWRALMLKYRGLIPEIIAGDRFHRLLIAVGSDIVKHEDLTAEQSEWMGDLISTAKENLAREGGVTFATSKARFAQPLIIAWAIFAALSATIRLAQMLK